MTACVVCGGEFERAPVGRPRETCGDACRARRSRRRRRPSLPPSEFRDGERQRARASFEEMQATTMQRLVLTYGGHRHGLEPKTVERVEQERRVFELVDRILGPQQKVDLGREKRAAVGVVCQRRVGGPLRNTNQADLS